MVRSVGAYAPTCRSQLRIEARITFEPVIEARVFTRDKAGAVASSRCFLILSKSELPGELGELLGSVWRPDRHTRRELLGGGLTFDARQMHDVGRDVLRGRHSGEVEGEDECNGL